MQESASHQQKFERQLDIVLLVTLALVKKLLFLGASSQATQGAALDGSKKPSQLQQAVASAVTATRRADDKLRTEIGTASETLDVNAGMAELQHFMRHDVLDHDKLHALCSKVLNAYRTGDFGRYTLDSLERSLS